jgi:hypothetical protein
MTAGSWRIAVHYDVAHWMVQKHPIWLGSASLCGRLWYLSDLEVGEAGPDAERCKVCARKLEGRE